MLTIEEYAIDAVCAGAEGCIEDDLNESGDIADDQHQAAIHLAYQIIRYIRANPTLVIQYARRYAKAEADLEARQASTTTREDRTDA